MALGDVLSRTLLELPILQHCFWLVHSAFLYNFYWAAAVTLYPSSICLLFNMYLRS